MKWNHIAGIVLIGFSLSAGVEGCPSPFPPGPSPTPTPTPTPAPGNLHVLIVREASGVNPWLNTAVRMRKWLDDHCKKGAGDDTGWRVHDPHADLSKESAWVAPLMKAVEGKPLPYVIIDTGQQKFGGPMPGSEEEAIQVFKQYGGE